MSEQILKNIQELQQLFEETKAFVEQEFDAAKIVIKLESCPPLFRSIAYEATSMVLGLRDIEVGQDLVLWKQFLVQHGAQHSTQIHVGLGWALAQQRLDAQVYFSDLEPMLRWRVLDGYGYYDGFFRRRKALQGLLPDGLVSKNAISVYTQGLGRSLWYTSKGDTGGLLKLINMLPTERHADLWRGVGIASTYVGGGDNLFWQKLWILAAPFQPQLAAGAAMAVKSRIESRTLDDHDFLNAGLWCKMSVDEINNLVKKKTSTKHLFSKEVYFEWVQQLDDYFKTN